LLQTGICLFYLVLLEEEALIIVLLMFLQAEKIDQALGRYLQETAQEIPPIQTEEQTVNQTVLKCPSCGIDMVLQNRREGMGKFISCMGYPNCRNAVWFPGIVENVELSGESCSEVCES
jgi:DNA topoisomerase-3